jgi:hypothetical protein
LADISLLVEKITIDGDHLAIHFAPELFTFNDGITEKRLRVLTCAPPYAGHVPADIPASVEQVLRLHNGMQASDYMPQVQWHVFDGKSFVIDWSLYWTADPEDPQELFSEPPQVPMTDGDDIWLLHPQEITTSGERALVRMSHETAGLSKSLSFSAGGAWLRLLGWALRLDNNRTPSLLSELRGE